MVAEGPVVQAPDEFILYPENVPIWRLFNAVWTQWRHGFDGRTGLDYTAVRCAPAFRRIPRAEREEIFDGICVMELAYLDEIRLIRAEEKR